MYISYYFFNTINNKGDDDKALEGNTYIAFKDKKW